MKKLFITILFLLLCLPARSFAANVFLTSDKDTFTQNEEFLVQAFVDTEDVMANAVEGSIVFPADILELKEIRDGNSIINFWVDKPSSTVSGKVSFSGITTGGFSGNKRFLFGMVFESKKLGSSFIDINDVKVLQNDGIGTELLTTKTPFSFSIFEESDGRPKENLQITDNEPPEGFTPLISNDPTIFNGKYFLVFSTVDKGVGIGHYEVREGIWNDYVVAESPYVLNDQSLSKDIIVKAVDKAGNKRLVKIKARNPKFGLEEFLILGIILAICFYLGQKIYKKIWSKKHTH